MITNTVRLGGLLARHTTKLCLGLAALILSTTQSSLALGPRVAATAPATNDLRLLPLKDLDGYFPFQVPASKESWAARSEQVRRQILVSQGLWPMPSKTPLNAVIHGRMERDACTMEKVYFESVPGFYVTGNLYRPKGKSGPRPAVLCPHGHWTNGRFLDSGAQEVRQSIVAGAERFEEGGRSPLQARCIQLARMGCVVFHYDMIGYADSVQISQALAHGFAKQRPEMNTTENWGLFSPQAEAHLQSVMGLQTWASIRALDFLCNLPDVDPGRIAVTGASGGGTQTFILCAIDQRPAVAFPAVMVSTGMQGGCTCENASLLRVNTGNIEFAGLFAPKPLGMTAADDWTREMPTKGFPELKQLYQLLGQPDWVMLKPLLHFGHNYNYVSRAAMYSWINKHLKLGLPEPIVEPDFQRFTREQLSVWDDAHPAPRGGPEFERSLLNWFSEAADKQLAAKQGSVADCQQTFGAGVDIVLGRNLATAGEVEFHQASKAEKDAYVETAGLLRNRTYQEELPLVILKPHAEGKRAVIWLSTHGKEGLYRRAQGDGYQPRPEVRKLLDAGLTVLGVDMLFQGELAPDAAPATKTRRVKNPREAAAYTFGYNHALFAQRVHDILTVLQYARSQDPKPEMIGLAGLAGAGHWAAAARAQAREAIACLAADTGGFRFGKILDIHHVDFLPGGAKYGDLPGLLALGAPGKTWLAGEGGEPPPLTSKVYQSAQALQQITVYSGSPDWAGEGAAEWLVKTLK